MDKELEKSYKLALIELFGTEKAKRLWIEFKKQDVLISKGICKTGRDLHKYLEKYGSYDYQEGYSL